MQTHSALSDTGGKPSPQNVLFVFCDQLRFDCLGFAGKQQIKTPNIDRLAQSSAVYTQAYTSTPVCVPARHSLMTGLRNGAHRWANNDPAPGALPELPTMMTELATAGYHTHSVGKTHFKGRSYGFQKMEQMEECPHCILEDDYLLYLREKGVTTRFQHGMRDLLYFQPPNIAHAARAFAE